MKKGLIVSLFLLGALACTRKESEPLAEEKAAPQEEKGAAHEEFIKLTPEAAEATQIQTSPAELKALSVGLSAPARVTFTQNGVAKVAARVPGRIADLDTTLGAKVKKGDVLAHLESPELTRARADYLAAATKARVAEGNYRREKELKEKGISSEKDMRQAEAEAAAAQADMNATEGRLHAFGLSEGEIGALKANEHYSSRFPARAPLDGTVVEIGISVGQTVDGATPLFTVADLRELWVVLDVFEAQLPLVRVGQPVFVTVPAAPDQRIEGRIAYIGDLVDEKTRAVAVRVAVPNGAGLLKPGMFAQAEIESAAGGADGGDRTPHVVVPAQAVQKVGDQPYVFVREGKTRFRALRVRTGEKSATEIEVLSGLEPKTEVVTQGAFILKSELSKESLGEGE